MKRVIYVVLLLLSGCMEHWRNPDPNRDGDRDLYECRHENTYTSGALVDGFAVVGPSVNGHMVNQCLRARGWRRVR